MLISRTGITQAAAASPPQPRCRMPLARTLREVRPSGQLSLASLLRLPIRVVVFVRLAGVLGELDHQIIWQTLRDSKGWPSLGVIAVYFWCLSAIIQVLWRMFLIDTMKCYSWLYISV